MVPQATSGKLTAVSLSDQVVKNSIEVVVEQLANDGLSQKFSKRKENW